MVNDYLLCLLSVMEVTLTQGAFPGYRGMEVTLTQGAFSGYRGITCRRKIINKNNATFN